MAKERTLEDMYMDLISEAASFEGINSSDQYQYNDDDGEDFMTSKEIIKNEETIKEKFGGLPAVGGDNDIEEDVHFKLYNKKHVHKYTDKEMQEIRTSCENTIVHDYGEHDIYHLTDDERAENDMLAELSLKLGTLKRTYRKVDQYIEAMRIVIQAWKLLEQNNYIHTKDEFFKLVAEGKIVSNRIIMPKLKNMDKYNIDMIIKYISNPDADPTDLLPKKEEVHDSWYDQFMEDDNENDENEIDEMERLLSPEEAQWLVDNIDNPPMMKVHYIKPKMIRQYENNSGFRSRFKKKKYSKKKRYEIESLNNILKKIETNPNNRDDLDYNRSYIVTNSMFDDGKKEKSFWDDLYYDGSWVNKNDLFLYNMAIREEILKQHPPRERYLTYADKELSSFFTSLEACGVNVVELRRKMDTTGSDIADIEKQEVKRSNKKLESAVLQRITELNKSSKFKKIVGKAEDALNKYYDD